MSQKSINKNYKHLNPPLFPKGHIQYAATISLLYTIIICLLWNPLSASSTDGVYTSTKHGTSVKRISGESDGDCIHCHDEHASRDGVPTSGGPYDYLLFKRNDNDLCYTCHNLSGKNNVYQGSTIYNSSSHATDSNTYWPGTTPPARTSSDNGKCLNCHTPHGYKDASGLIPGLTFSREEKLCQTCHDGSPTTNIKGEITKTYRHPTSDYTDRHSQSEGDTPRDFGSSNRHAECVDCHNPHYAKSDASQRPPDASNLIKGVSGIDVINGLAGTHPSYNYISPSTDISYEYQLCFKCHSSWTTQPVGQSDMATLFNYNNPSYHPIESAGKNLNINDDAFVNRWTSTSKMYCSDCHTSDNTLIRGPHGSSNNHILKKNYPVTSHTAVSTELCFDCHKYDTYANNDFTPTPPLTKEIIWGYSRFNLHIKHVVEEQVSCYSCHNSHASTSLKHLIVTGRTPGVTAYTESPNTSTAGNCTSTCHAKEDYTITYAR